MLQEWPQADTTAFIFTQGQGLLQGAAFLNLKEYTTQHAHGFASSASGTMWAEAACHPNLSMCHLVKAHQHFAKST
eukprot:3126940-Amphidinium_carterae.1